MSVFDLEKIKEELSVHNPLKPCAIIAIQIIVRLCEKGRELEAANAELRDRVADYSGEIAALMTAKLELVKRLRELEAKLERYNKPME